MPRLTEASRKRRSAIAKTGAAYLFVAGCSAEFIHPRLRGKVMYLASCPMISAPCSATKGWERAVENANSTV